MVISGPSGSGKGTLIERLVALTPGLAVSVSATTRPRRRGEVEGREYFFLSENDFRRRVDEGWFLEWAAYSSHLYGTPRLAVEEHLAAGRDVILEIELDGAQQVLERCPDALMVFIMPPSIAELERRLRGRKTESERAIEDRLARAQEEIEAVRARVGPGRRRFDYVIVNDSVKRASEELARVIQQTKEEDEQADSRRDPCGPFQDR
ncbi:MAG: guanylate kinase [bacterium]